LTPNLFTNNYYKFNKKLLKLESNILYFIPSDITSLNHKVIDAIKLKSAIKNTEFIKEKPCILNTPVVVTVKSATLV
jgi:hypothetical protein